MNNEALEVLMPDVKTFQCAKCLAGEQKLTGRVDHHRFSLKCRNCRISEVCVYRTDNSGFEMVKELLIDEGWKDYAHRKIMLDPHISLIGVCIMEHKTYPFSGVADFN